MAVALAERAFGLQHFGVDVAFDNDLGVGGDFEIHGLALRDAQRATGETARHRHFILRRRKFLRAGEHDDRRAADHDGDRHRLAQLLVFQPVQISACAAEARGHAHAEAIFRLQAGAIRAHVADARFGILRHAAGGGEIGRGVEARRRDRHRQARQPLPGLLQLVARDDDVMAGRRFDEHRRDRMVDRMHPDIAELLDRHAHACGIDLVRGRQGAAHDGHVVFLALGANHIGEQERLALAFRIAADELPAHQRMQLGVLVDRPVDPQEQPARFEIGEVFLEIRGRATALLGCHM